MKAVSPSVVTPTLVLLVSFSLSLSRAENPVSPAAEGVTSRAAAEQNHRSGAQQLAERQDQLTADVQQLKIEQTEPKVIELLDDVETVMNEAIDQLEQHDTGGKTIATQTEVIEKIFNAAKQRQQQGDSQDNNKGAQGMMEMMKRMMGENAEADEKKKDGKPTGDAQAGTGASGESSSASTPSSGGSSTATEERRVPKASSNSHEDFPEEFRTLLDGYNRALTK